MRTIFAVIAVLVLFAVSVTSASTHGPRIKVKNGTSTNWSGYAAVLGSLTNPVNNVVTDVKGTWTVQSVNCTGVTANTYSSAWVGIDGYTSNSVEQLGTEHDCINGQPRYYAWYEMYPKGSYKVALSVQPGDVMNGEVKYANGQFTLTLNSARGAFKTTQRANRADRSSAEWIMEAPWSGGVLPLANFGTMPFTSSTATINGVTKTVSGFTNDQINMVTSDGTTIKALTSPLASDGASFSEQWQHN